MINWIVEGDLATVCPLKKEAFIRIEIPQNSLIEITHNGISRTYPGETWGIRSERSLTGGVPGKEYYLSGWVSGTRKNGVPFYSDEFPQDIKARAPITALEEMELPNPPGTGIVYVTGTDSRGTFAGSVAFVLRTESGQYADYLIRTKPPNNNYNYGSHALTEWKRTIPPTPQEEAAEAAAFETYYVVEIFNEQDDLINELTYPSPQPSIRLIKGNYTETIIEKVPLYYVQFVQVQKNQKPHPDGEQLCRKILVASPLLNFPVPVGKGLKDSSFGDHTFSFVAEYCSPPGVSKYPRISHTCQCNERCPQGTICSIQNGDKICCYNKQGDVIKIVDAGCFEADHVC